MHAHPCLDRRPCAARRPLQAASRRCARNKGRASAAASGVQAPARQREAPAEASSNGAGPDQPLAEQHAEEGSTSSQGGDGDQGEGAAAGLEGDKVLQTGPLLTVTLPLPRVLIIHTGGTLGMDPQASYAPDAVHGRVGLRPGTGGVFPGLKPGNVLENLLGSVPELRAFANMDLVVPFNRDSCRVGPPEWIRLARTLHGAREDYDAFLVVHGTDTLAYTAAALSLMLAGFRKPIVLTGSQLPLAMPRSDARQNLIDALTCATAFFTPPHVRLQEVALCFGGKLMRGNRAQKVNSSTYRAFDSLGYPALATLGTDVEWQPRYLLQPHGTYRPRFRLEPRVLRVPIVPGCDPRLAYGDLAKRGVRGMVLEAFGVGNMPDLPALGWLPWLQSQTKQGLKVYLASQCLTGPLQPELYHSGSVALSMGAEAGPRMTPECAAVKMMLCLAYKDIPLGVPIAGEV